MPGQAILDELPDERGLLLWKTYRGTFLWSALGNAERRELICAEAHRARTQAIDAVSGLDEIADALVGLAEMFRRPVTRSMVAPRCRAIEQWAAARGADHTALEFAQLAALCAPRDPSPAVTLAKRARDLAEYARAESWYWQAIVRARRSTQWEAYVLAMLGLGITHRLRGNYPAARRHMERGLRRARRQALSEREAMALHELTVLAIHTDHLPRTLRYAREALAAYGHGHPRLAALSHDLGVFWMNRGYFAHALEVFLAVPESFGSTADRVARACSIARAAGALQQPERFEAAAADVESLLDDATAASQASSVLLDVARGALSLGDPARATAYATRALGLARERAEAERLLLAEALLQEASAVEKVQRARPVPVPAGVADLTADLVGAIGAATPVPG